MQISAARSFVDTVRSSFCVATYSGTWLLKIMRTNTPRSYQLQLARTAPAREWDICVRRCRRSLALAGCHFVIPQQVNKNYSYGKLLDSAAKHRKKWAFSGIDPTPPGWIREATDILIVSLKFVLY